MAVGTLTPKTIPGPFDTLVALAQNFAFQAGTVTDGDEFVCSGKEILIAFNSGATPRTITLTSVADEKQRTGDFGPYTVGAGLYSVFGQGLTTSKGWINSSQKIKATVSHAELVLVVLRLP